MGHSAFVSRRLSGSPPKSFYIIGGPVFTGTSNHVGLSSYIPSHRRRARRYFSLLGQEVLPPPLDQHSRSPLCPFARFQLQLWSSYVGGQSLCCLASSLLTFPQHDLDTDISFVEPSSESHHGHERICVSTEVRLPLLHRSGSNAFEDPCRRHQTWRSFFLGGIAGVGPRVIGGEQLSFPSRRAS